MPPRTSSSAPSNQPLSASLHILRARVLCALAEADAAARRIQKAAMSSFCRRIPVVLRMFGDMGAGQADVVEEMRMMCTRSYFDAWIVDQSWWRPRCDIGYCMQMLNVQCYAAHDDAPCDWCWLKVAEWAAPMDTVDE